MSEQRQFISPQPGFQTSFLSSPADIVIGGGAAGGGKSYALLLEPLRHAHNPKFYAVIFRRTLVQVKNSGGLWDTSKEIYSKLRDDAGRPALATESPPKWKFPSGAKLSFAQLEYEQTKLEWDGAQVAFLGFDELIHFTPGQFWYLIGRNRSSSGVRPYVRATTNPQSSGWVKRLISWWIYPDDYEDTNLRGMPIPERAGVVRYLARRNEVTYWGDTPEEAIAAMPEEDRIGFRTELVKSFTFIPGLLTENKALTDKDPGYEGNLLAQDKAHANRLLRGCWYDAAGENELFAYEDLYDMFSNTFAPGGKTYLTADVAMEGSDVFRVGIWNGWRLEHRYNFEKSDGLEIWETIKRLAHQHGIEGRNIAFDANGVGNFLTGFFKSSYDFRSQSVPIEEAAEGAKAIKVNYANLRTQCAFRVSKAVADHVLFIDGASEMEKDYIINEFQAHEKTGVNNAGKLTITPKEAVKALIHRSPDYFDMILLRAVFDLSLRKKSWLYDNPIEIEHEQGT